jgi:hypothetical protein
MSGALRQVFAKLGFDIQTDKVVDASKKFDDLIRKVRAGTGVF